MPNSSGIQDKVSQNGHYPIEPALSEQPLDLNNPSLDLASSALNPSVSINDDWSSLTKDLIDTLPRVWTRGLLYFLIVFAAIALPWAMLSKVDETGTARGRIEPKGATQRLDAAITGTVTSVKVKEGQTVKAKQVLLELESDVLKTDLQQAEAKLEGQMNRLIQMELMKNQLEMTTRTHRLQNQAQASGQLAQINQTRQQLDFNRTATTSIQELLAKDQDRVKRFRNLRRDGVVSGVQVDDAERAVIESQQRLQKALSDIQQAQSELQKQQSTYDKGLREGELAILESGRQLKDLQGQILGIQSEIAQNRTQIKSLQLQLQQRVLRAPIDGTIFQLPIQKAGAVVQAGQMIAQIAAQRSIFIFKAQMPTSESGFLRKGMPVKLKFDAYPFQDYGVVPGHLHSISPDTKVLETPQGRAEVFELEIDLDQNYIQSQSKRIALTPGQTATAEVIVRQRHVIDFILDPFKKLQKGGLKL